jgi:hypothetical protein
MSCELRGGAAARWAGETAAAGTRGERAAAARPPAAGRPWRVEKPKWGSDFTIRAEKWLLDDAVAVEGGQGADWPVRRAASSGSSSSLLSGASSM